MATTDDNQAKRLKCDNLQPDIKSEEPPLLYTYKLKLSNIPKYIQNSVLKTLLKTRFEQEALALTKFSCKKSPHSEIAFLGFISSGERDLATNTLKDWSIQKNAITTSLVTEEDDARMFANAAKNKDRVKQLAHDMVQSALPEDEQVQDQCTPLWR
jgi:hypothetical protein